MTDGGFVLQDRLRWEDLFILQIGEGIAQSFTTKHFVEMGATCVLVELPHRANADRSGQTVEQGGAGSRGSVFEYLNWGKKSVTCDYERPEGADLLHKICGQADILVRSPFEPEEAELVWMAKKDQRTRLIELVISPFGMSGPLSHCSGDSGAALAYGGITYTSGDPDREPLGPPNEVAEFMAGAHGFVAALAALLRRLRHGSGDFIDLSILDAVVMADEYNLSLVEANDLVRKRYYSRQLLDYPSDVFECRDGYVALTGADFSRLALLIERPDLEDSQFRSPHYRTQNWEELAALIVPFFRERTVDQIVEAAQSLRIPLAPVLFVAEMPNHPHLTARAAVVPRTLNGEKVMMMAPASQVREARIPDDPAPAAGEDTAEILGRFIEEDELRAASSAGLIQGRHG